MKKTILAFSIIVFIAACNNSQETTPSTSTETKNPPAAADTAADKGLALAGKSDCFQCHKINETSTGPAYMRVAEKYPKNDAVIDSLSKKIINGGAGNWGTIPMIPHPQISSEDAKAMVTYI